MNRSKILFLTVTLSLIACDKGDAPKAASAEYKTERHDEKDGDKHEGAHEESELLKLSAQEIAAAEIKVSEVKPRDVAGRIVVTATIEANQDRLAHVAPRIAGRIVKVNANLGDRVKPGQALALLDSLELGEARSAYLQAQSETALARTAFERAERLKGEQIIPEKDYLRAKTEYEKAKTQLRAAADKLRLLGVTPEGSAEGKGASVFPLTSPYPGTVIEKHAVLGELAKPDESLFTVADLSVLWIEANLFEKDLGKVAVGAEATVSVAAYPEEAFKGRLTYISSIMDKDTRTLKARIEVPNPGGKLKPEMFATAAIETAARSEVMLVPEEAVVLIEGKPAVFVEEHGAFEPKTVELGDKLRGGVVIKSGLEPGARTVTSGAYALKARLLKSTIGEGHAH